MHLTQMLEFNRRDRPHCGHIVVTRAWTYNVYSMYIAPADGRERTASIGRGLCDAKTDRISATNPLRLESKSLFTI